MIKLIAYYLPQFHPTPENDEWWGKGFTEWTNVAKAKPLFKGHKQPKIPADLGFYDLRLPQSRAAQADLAKKYGITAFCYWHYWFGNGRKILNLPFEEVVKMKEPNFPFCLAWANHSWFNKSWTSRSGHFNLEKSKLLIAQTYPGVDDYERHFYDLLAAFKDTRYLRVHDRLLFVIFDPINFTDFPLFRQTWERLAQKEGLPGFYFVAHLMKDMDKESQVLLMGYDSINLSLHQKPFKNNANVNSSIWFKRFKNHFRLKPQTIEYSKAIEIMDTDRYKEPTIIPTIIPNWDHTPRSGNYGRLFLNCTPSLFKKHVVMVLKKILNKDEEDRVAFIKSWNEWGEGNYLEPDLEYGTKRLEALYEALLETQS